MKTADIHVRDPFVLPHQGKYYLYGTRGAHTWDREHSGFDVYVGTDLENWEAPRSVFEYFDGFYGQYNFWAPEVHIRQGRFYLFASFKSDTMRRGTAILSADSPTGPFVPLSEGPVTPKDWECLDGTFYADQQGKPWIVFCHEWVQTGDGEVCAMPLTDDLKKPAGKPVVLFKASACPYAASVRPVNGQPGLVTDGPFLHRTGAGKLECLWATCTAGGYMQCAALSDNGEIDGQFTQLAPLFDKDGGHGMVFEGLNGKTYLTLHSPNQTPFERPKFIEMQESNGILCP